MEKTTFAFVFSFLSRTNSRGGAIQLVDVGTEATLQLTMLCALLCAVQCFAAMEL